MPSTITTLLTLLATTPTLTLALIPPSLPLITPAPGIPLAIRQQNTSFPTTTSVAPFVDSKLLISCSSAYTSLENSRPNVTNSALSSWFDSLDLDITFSPLSTGELNTASAISSLCTAFSSSYWNLPPPSSLSQAYVEYVKETSSWEGANAAKVTSLASACAVQDKDLAAEALILVKSNCVTALSVQFGLASVPTATVMTTILNGNEDGNGGQQGGGQGGQGGQQSGTRTVSTSRSSGGAGGIGPRETGFAQAVMAFAAAGAVVGAAL